MVMKRKSLLKLTAIFAAVLLSFEAAGTAVCFAQEGESYTQHTVGAGETLGGIAKKYGVTVDEIARVNGIDNVNLIAAGAVLKIPSAQGTSDEPKPADSPKTAEPAVVTADFKVGVQNPQP